MNPLYFPLALLCFLTVSGSVPQAQAASGKAILEVAKGGIESLGKGINLYNKFLDKIVPWEELNKTIARLDQFRADYSKEASELIGEVKTLMLDGMDAYHRATQSVYEWCDLAVNLLHIYRKLFVGKMNQSKFDAARKTLLKVLSDGIQKMNVAQHELGDSSSSFNVASGKLIQLNHRLTYDFNENSAYYESQITHIRKVAYGAAAPFLFFGMLIAAGVVEGKVIPELKEKMESVEKWHKEITLDVENAYKDIDKTKAKLQEEINHIGVVKSQTEATQFLVDMDDTAEIEQDILRSVDDLISKCEEYQNRHIGSK